MTSENQVIALDQKGICISSGAACSSGKVEPSHVLKAMKVDDKYIHSAIRVSLGWDSTKEQIETFFNIWKYSFSNQSELRLGFNKRAN